MCCLHGIYKQVIGSSNRKKEYKNLQITVISGFSINPVFSLLKKLFGAGMVLRSLVRPVTTIESEQSINYRIVF